MMHAYMQLEHRSMPYSNVCCMQKAAKRQDMNFHDCCTHICLNTDQCHIVMYNRAWCKSYINVVRHGENQKGYRLFSKWS